MRTHPPFQESETADESSTGHERFDADIEGAGYIVFSLGSSFDEAG